MQSEFAAILFDSINKCIASNSLLKLWTFEGTLDSRLMSKQNYPTEMHRTPIN